MVQLCHLSLADPGFARDQYRGIRFADLDGLFEDVDHIGTAGDDLLVSQKVLLHLGQLALQLPLDGLFFLETPLQGFNLGNVSLADHHTDQFS